MTCRSVCALLVCVLAAATLSTAASADDCKLALLATLDFTEGPSGQIMLPVTMQGTPKLMLLDTGGQFSAVDPLVTDDLKLVTYRLRQGFVANAAGNSIQQSAVIHGLDIGRLHVNEIHVAVWPSPISRDGTIAGFLGADLLRNYDVDIDFGSHQVKFFSQDHCPGKVVYWSAPSVAVVPMHMEYSGHIIVPVTLDGHEIDALFDTGASTTHLSLEAAKNDFKLVPGSSDMPKVGEFNGAASTPVYLHTFKSLALQDITINNPKIAISEDLEKTNFQQNTHLGSRLSDADERVGVTDMEIGTREMRHFHIYIAYKEQKFYISPAAEPVAAATAPSTQPASAGTAAATH
ncbi:MAG TPA: aspartyl protease family protein [Rhizomicrobium sp.]|nr:aspartyl protease family protein [Rhizomicrobium sp.]